MPPAKQVARFKQSKFFAVLIAEVQCHAPDFRLRIEGQHRIALTVAEHIGQDWIVLVFLQRAAVVKAIG